MSVDTQSEAVLAMVLAGMSRDEITEQLLRALRKLDRPSAHGVLEHLRSHGPHMGHWREAPDGESWRLVADVLDALSAIEADL